MLRLSLWAGGRSSKERHRQPRSTSVLHAEKLWLLLDVFQIYALIWSTSLAWPWPRTWLTWTRWTVWTNFDALHGIAAHTPVGVSNVHNSHFGEWDQYFTFAAAMCLFPALIAAGVVAFAVFDRQSAERSKDRVAGYVVIATQVYLLPPVLHLGRLYVCASEDVVCGQPSSLLVEILLLAACTVSVAGLLLAAGWMTQRYSSELNIHTNNAGAERFMLTVELAYMLQLDNEWWERCMFVLSSFNHRGRHFRAYTMGVKLVMALLHFACANRPGLQISLMWLALSGWAVWSTLVRPFRSRSSNVVLAIVQWTLIINTTFALYTGNGVRSSVLIPSIQSYWLFVINTIAVSLLGCTVLASWWFRELAPGDAAYRRLTDREKTWIDAISAVRKRAVAVYLMPPEIALLPTIEKDMADMHHAWLEAKMMQSLLLTHIGDTLDELCLLYNKLLPVTTIRTVQAAEALELVAPIIQQRFKERILMNPSKRKLLTKITAFNTFSARRKKAHSAYNFFQQRDLVSSPRSFEDFVTPEAAMRETRSVLSRRVLQHHAFLLIQLADAWTNFIDRWELEFWETTGRMPTAEDKTAIVSWYDSLEVIEALLRGLNTSYVSARVTRRTLEDEQLIRRLQEAQAGRSLIVDPHAAYSR